MKYTGEKNEKATAWAEEKGFNLDAISGGSGATGGKSESSWRQQERVSREASQRSGIFTSGTTDVGGIFDHLINEFCRQVIARKEESQRINSEISRLEDKIRELRLLKEELSQKFESDS